MISLLIILSFAISFIAAGASRPHFRRLMPAASRRAFFSPPPISRFDIFFATFSLSVFFTIFFTADASFRRFSPVFAIFDAERCRIIGSAFGFAAISLTPHFRLLPFSLMPRFAAAAAALPTLVMLMIDTALRRRRRHYAMPPLFDADFRRRHYYGQPIFDATLAAAP